MPANYLLAVDIGSSSVRSLLTDLTGKVVSLHSRDWAYDSPGDIAPLGKELNPDILWHIVCQNVKNSVHDAGISGKDIAGVSASSQREGMVLLDVEGQVLYAGPNIDLRALMEGLSIDGKFGNEIFSITGHIPSFLFAPAKLNWFETNRPEVYSRIATVLTISDWIIFKLCGELTSEVCGASELGLTDIKEGTWSKKLQDLLRLPQDIYPRLVPAGSMVGQVTSQAAIETGLDHGTPVAAGVPDTQGGMIGMGIKDTGQTGIVIGWSAPVQRITRQPVFDTEARIWTSSYVLPEKWVLESSTGEAGNAYRWLREVIFSHESSNQDEKSYELMDRLARQVSPGADGVMAFIGPTAMDMSRLGLKLGGFIFPVPLSANDISKAQLIRAALENLCFAIRANCLQIEMVSGDKIHEVTIGGGLAKSSLLAEILASVLDLPVFVPAVNEVSGLGAAMCAAAGSGIYSCMQEAIEMMRSEKRRFEPEQSTALEYSECYERWRSTAEELEKMSEGM